MDGPPLCAVGKRRPAIGDFAGRVEKPSKHGLANGYTNGRARCPGPGAAAKPGRIFKRDRAYGRWDQDAAGLRR